MKNIYAPLFICIFSFHFSSAQTHQLWGMSFAGGGIDSGGTIFNISLDGTVFGVTHSFDTLSGFQPYGSLIQAPNGSLFGMTFSGGINNAGVIFHYDPAGNAYTKDFDFDYYTSGGDPEGTFMLADDSLLYGMASSGGKHGDGTIFSFDPNSTAFVDLYDFSDSVGKNPYGCLIQANDGKLYGLTTQGGPDSVGTLFSFDLTNNTLSVLHNFTHPTGDVPNGSLLQATNGKLFGMTSQGGLYGNGVIFSFNPADSIYTSIHDFDGVTGANPYGSLIQASDSLLYGMTSNGGANVLYGTIFSFDPKTNTHADLFDFTGTNGSTPEGDLMQASNGKLYGMTSFGDSLDAGVIFSFDQSNKNYVDLHDFNVSNGQQPWGDLIEIVITGIQEKSNLQNIHLYPNPAMNTLAVGSQQLAGKKVTIEFYNVVGEKVYNELLTADRQLPTVIDVSSLSPGMYFIEVTNENGMWNGKFIKE